MTKIYENFVRTLETVRNREVSVPRGLTVMNKTNWSRQVNNKLILSVHTFDLHLSTGHESEENCVPRLS